MQSVPLTPTLPAYGFDILAEWPVSAFVSTRQGGVSPAPWNTLNFSAARGDDPRNVRQNLSLFAAACGFSRRELVVAGQIRADGIQQVGPRHKGCRLPGQDGLTTNAERVPLFTVYADCVPVVAYDKRRHALGVCHAGWQGTTRRIARKLMAFLQRAFGARPQDCLCALGPSIGPASYEVGPTVIEAVQARLAPADAWLRPAARPGHAYLDLWQANCAQLMEAGVPARQIEISRLDTAQRTDVFFSHRAEKGRCGLFGMLCWLDAA